MRMGFWALLALALCLILGTKQADKIYWAERFDLPAEVVKGGDLGVEEQVTASSSAQAAPKQGGPGSRAREPEAALQAEQGQPEQNDQGWLLIVLGGLALAIGSGLIHRTLRPYRRPARIIPGPTTEPPGELAPAVAGGLRSRTAGVNWNLALATFFELAGRGHLAIDELPKGRWRGRDFQIRRLDGEEGLRPREEALMALLLVDDKGVTRESVRLSQLSDLTASERWKRFADSMRAELITANIVSKARKEARGKVIRLSLVTILLTLLPSWCGLCQLSSPGEFWPLATAGALLLLVSVLGLRATSAISVLSDEGQQMVATWESFYRHLLDVCRFSAPANEDEFERYLPYAAAYGLLHSWAERFQRSGRTETPAYFWPVQDEDQQPMAAFVAMTLGLSTAGVHWTRYVPEFDYGY